MLRQERLWIWIAALVAAGIGWNMHLVAWACEIDYFGAASWAFGSDVAAKTGAPVMNHISTACALGSAVLMAAGLLAEASNSCHTEREVNVRA